MQSRSRCRARGCSCVFFLCCTLGRRQLVGSKLQGLIIEKKRVKTTAKTDFCEDELWGRARAIDQLDGARTKVDHRMMPVQQRSNVCVMAWILMVSWAGQSGAVSTHRKLNGEWGVGSARQSRVLIQHALRWMFGWAKASSGISRSLKSSGTSLLFSVGFCFFARIHFPRFWIWFCWKNQILDLAFKKRLAIHSLVVWTEPTFHVFGFDF